MDIGPVGDGVASAMVGGVASQLGGGKFENGAITSSFSYMFNKVLHDISPINEQPINTGNPEIEKNLQKLNDKIVESGVSDDKFTILITGGARYIGGDGKVYSLTDGSLIKGSAPNSRHLTKNGAIGVDVVIKGAINKKTFIGSLPGSNFDPKRTIGYYPSDPHAHIELYNRQDLRAK